MSETETREHWQVRVTLPAGSPDVRDELFGVIADAVSEAEEDRWPDRDGWDLSVEGGPDMDTELSRLRGVVEAVQALADKWAEWSRTDHAAAESSLMPRETRREAYCWGEASGALRAVLAPVSSSGEAESGEACGAVHPKLDLVLPCQTLGRHALHRSTTTYGAVVWWDDDTPAPVPSGGPDLLAALGSAVEKARQDRRAATVPSGGQADGEAVDSILTEHFGHTVYEATGDQPEECHDECPACLAGEQITALLAARPVLSREALRERLDGHWPFSDNYGVGCGCGWYDNGKRSVWRDHLADVLTAGGEQE